jgi:hypothetical protein
MRRPKERGMVSQFDGKRYWVAGWRIEPGESGLMRPSTQTAMVTERKDLVGGWVVKRWDGTYCRNKTLRLGWR